MIEPFVKHWPLVRRIAPGSSEVRHRCKVGLHVGRLGGDKKQGWGVSATGKGTWASLEVELAGHTDLVIGSLIPLFPPLSLWGL